MALPPMPGLALLLHIPSAYAFASHARVAFQGEGDRFELIPCR
jgi:hypothetical protein